MHAFGYNNSGTTVPRAAVGCTQHTAAQVVDGTQQEGFFRFFHVLILPVICSKQRNNFSRIILDKYIEEEKKCATATVVDCCRPGAFTGDQDLSWLINLETS